METYVYIIAISSTFNKQRYEYKLTQPCLAQHGIVNVFLKQKFYLLSIVFPHAN